MRIEDLACREVVEVLTDYLESVLPTDRRVTLEQHLLFCEGCAEYLEQMRSTVALVGRLREEDVPPVVMDRLLRAMPKEER